MLTTNVGVTTTYFVGNYYEVTGGVVTKYYYAGSQRVAMRKNNVLSYLLSDHLGSTSLVTDSSGTVINQTKYKAWGETRYSSGTEQTKYTYTGQYSYVSDFGLMFYNARWYDSSLGRFAQADTIVPSGSQGLDRYAYTLNNPIRYADPSGHVPADCYGTNYCGASNSNLLSNGNRGVAGLGKAEGGVDNQSSSQGARINIPSKLFDLLRNGIVNTSINYYNTVSYWDAWLYQNAPSAIGYMTPSVSISGGVLTAEGSVTTLFNYRSMEIDTYTTAGGGGVISFPPGGASANLGVILVYGASSNSSWEGEYLSATVSVYDGFGGYGSQGYSVSSEPNGLPATVDPVSNMHIITNALAVGVGTPGASASLTYGQTVTNSELMNLDWPFPVPLVLPNNPYMGQYLFP